MTTVGVKWLSQVPVPSEKSYEWALTRHMIIYIMRLTNNQCVRVIESLAVQKSGGVGLHMPLPLFPQPITTSLLFATRSEHQDTGSFVKIDNTVIKVGIEKKLFFCQGR